MAQRSKVGAKGSIPLGPHLGLQVLGGSTVDVSKGLKLGGFKIDSLSFLNRKQDPEDSGLEITLPKIKKIKLF